MSLSKSKYVSGVQCEKKLWLEINKPEEKEDINESVLDTGNYIHEVAKYLLGEHINIDFNEDLEEMIKNTISTIESYKDVVITEASFNYNNNFCSVDILSKKGSKYEMYEVKGSTEIKDIYIKDLAYQYYVLKSLGLNVEKCFLVILNNKYKRCGDLELDKLFIKVDVTEEIKSLFDEVNKNVGRLSKVLDSNIEPSEDIEKRCFKPYPCLFYKYCTRNLPHPNVFDIAEMKLDTKLKLYKSGVCSYQDLLKENVDSKTRQQLEYEVYNKEPYINKEKINEFLKTLSYPIYFLDFETYQQPIPLFDGIRPFEQVPFQYSLHYYEKEGGDLKHKEYLGDGITDPRRALAERLVEDIPLDVCTVAYNMKFEKMVIKALASLYPDLKDHLMNIYDNMKDLMVPFKNRNYYAKDLEGSYSIKYVLPSLYPDDPSLDYHNLDMVHNGKEAMTSYSNLSSLPEKDREDLRKNMLEYCKLDTYAMVKILKYLKR